MPYLYVLLLTQSQTYRSECGITRMPMAAEPVRSVYADTLRGPGPKWQTMGSPHDRIVCPGDVAPPRGAGMPSSSSGSLAPPPNPTRQKLGIPPLPQVCPDPLVAKED